MQATYFNGEMLYADRDPRAATDGWWNAPERPGLGYSHMKRGSENNGNVIVRGQPPWQRPSSMDLNTTFCHNQMGMEGVDGRDTR